MADRRTFLRSLAALPLVGGWAALLSKTAVAAPAPSRDGLAVMRLNGETLVVDMNRFRPLPNERVVVSHFDGRLEVEPVIFEDLVPWFGKRSAGTDSGRRVAGNPGRVWIVGTVVEAV